MSERKVLNKYIPPNFDPARIPKRTVPKPKQHTVRLMTPFSMRCNTCGEYIYKGRKFNARKETVEGEMYLSIKIFRFYIRCPVCAGEITFKTDPKNADYVAEHGAKRNFEPWRDELKEGEEAKNRRALEEMYNPMKALENKTYDSKREIDIMEGLDELRMVNARLNKVDTDAVFMRVAGKEGEKEAKRRLEEAEDDVEVRRAFAAAKQQNNIPQIEYDGWSDGEDERNDLNGEEDEILAELPPAEGSHNLLASSGIVVSQATCSTVGNHSLPPRPADVLGNAALSKAKKQALLGIKKRSA